MTPGLRKLGFTAHIVLSVGWLGAVAAYLALAIAGLTGFDAQRVRAAYLSMELVGTCVLVPLSLATLLAGLVQSLGTPWGLFRHWWVLAKLVLTTGATLVLIRHMNAVSRMSSLAAETSLSATDFRALRVQLVVHAAGGLLVLLSVTVLSVYKPWGLTPYGRRRQHPRREESVADRSPRRGAGARPVARPAGGTPRWVYVIGIHAVVLGLLFAVMHLTGGGPRIH